jgi:hypothetical protein
MLHQNVFLLAFFNCVPCIKTHAKAKAKVSTSLGWKQNKCIGVSLQKAETGGKNMHC